MKVTGIIYEIISIFWIALKTNLNIVLFLSKWNKNRGWLNSF